MVCLKLCEECHNSGFCVWCKGSGKEGFASVCRGCHGTGVCMSCGGVARLSDKAEQDKATDFEPQTGGQEHEYSEQTASDKFEDINFILNQNHVCS